jgi:haloacetate dehalogenase
MNVVHPFIPGFELRDVVLENGIMLRVAIGGSGAPLVMLHGHPQNHVTWRKVAPELAKYYTVILPDLRGYGDSSNPPAMRHTARIQNVSWQMTLSC